MRFYRLYIVFISFAIGCISNKIHAQLKLNEIQFGHITSYYFDKSGTNSDGDHIAALLSYIRYSRYFNDQSSISVKFLNPYFGYEKWPEFLEIGEPAIRAMMSFRLLYNKNIWNLNEKLRLDGSIGASYRFRDEVRLSNYRYNSEGIPIEAHYDTINHNEFGVTIGADLKYIIISRIQLGVNLDFTRYFDDYSENEMYGTIYFGFMF